ncbi:hypothetical protein B5C26_13355 [Photorhabdus luminescens]|nr:hypothetical protein B5C26_13355 [Photorhabdus luminescens]
MSNYCDMCGTNKHGSKYCPGCQEVAYIFHEQYLDPKLNLQLPDPDSEFMKQVREQTRGNNHD